MTFVTNSSSINRGSRTGPGHANRRWDSSLANLARPCSLRESNPTYGSQFGLAVCPLTPGRGFTMAEPEWETPPSIHMLLQPSAGSPRRKLMWGSSKGLWAPSNICWITINSWSLSTGCNLGRVSWYFRCLNCQIIYKTSCEWRKGWGMTRWTRRSLAARWDQPRGQGQELMARTQEAQKGQTCVWEVRA